MRRILIVLAAIPIFFAAGCSDSSDESSPGTDGTSTDSEQLLGIVWEWVSTTTPVERIESADPARYTLRFQADGQVQAKFDCNSGGGSYEITNNQLRFGPLMATRMACPEGTQDAVFMSQLGQISSFFMRDGDLFLEMPVDSGTMRFRDGGGSERGD